jgi:hypothetical protein
MRTLTSAHALGQQTFLMKYFLLILLLTACDHKKLVFVQTNYTVTAADLLRDAKEYGCMTNLVLFLVHSGEVCKVLGHHTYVGKISYTTTYRPDGSADSVPKNKCELCFQ